MTPAPVEEPDVGDEDAEEDEPAELAEGVEVVPDGMVPIGVEVSLNGGANFTIRSRIFYTPSVPPATSHRRQRKGEAGGEGVGGRGRGRSPGFAGVGNLQYLLAFFQGDAEPAAAEGCPP